MAKRQQTFQRAARKRKAQQRLKASMRGARLDEEQQEQDVPAERQAGRNEEAAEETTEE
jgi:hypothetical protein